MKTFFSAVAMNLAALLMVSCLPHPRLEDHGKTFTLHVGQSIELHPVTMLTVTLKQIGGAKNQGEFRLHEAIGNTSSLEWIAPGQYFKAKNLVGTGGLRLDMLEKDTATLTAFGGSPK